MARTPPLGQHFLVRDDIADRIIEGAGVAPGRRVLEIGPGEGVLTGRLVDAGVDLSVIEYDRTLAAGVRRTWPDVDVIEGDAARVGWPPFDVLVSNLPFQISSPVLFRLIDEPGWSSATLMVQREFARRLLAVPGTGDYGRLTVKVAIGANVEKVLHVPRSAFDPPPAVDATVVRVTPRPARRGADVADVLDGLVDAVFTQRRKQLRNSVAAFAASVGIGPTVAHAVLDELGWTRRRPATLTPDEYVELARRLDRAPRSG